MGADYVSKYGNKLSIFYNIYFYFIHNYHPLIVSSLVGSMTNIPPIYLLSVQILLFTVSPTENHVFSCHF